jgi:hypothetical protein
VKRLGPELKLPKLKGGEMKVPPFLSDLYFDLRERRLLPLVGLILVAIVATPILLGGGSEEAAPVPPPAAVSGGGAPASQTLTVVKAEPGLRSYKKRLGHRTPTNPFKQRFTGPRLNGAHLNEPATTTTTTTTSTSSSTGSTPEGSVNSEPTLTSPPSSQPSSPSPSGSSPSGGGTSGKEELPHDLTLFTFAIDVDISRIGPKPDGSVAESGPTPHKELLPPVALPGEKAPVVTYLGMGAKDGLPMFLVSPEVTATYGKGMCIAGTSVCQLMSLKEGAPAIFEYGPNHVRYKIEVVGIKPIVTGHS